tara:strand:- start:319 stop:525 length:207 start_codon:yes stop_codon:yes gene_type:complete
MPKEEEDLSREFCDGFYMNLFEKGIIKCSGCYRYFKGEIDKNFELPYCNKECKDEFLRRIGIEKTLED